MRARSASTALRRSRRTAATRFASRRGISSSPPRASAAPDKRPAPFTQVTPTRTDDGNLVAYLAEDAEYDDEQARLAGIQRLLVIAGYDAAPIDGVDGPKTQAALGGVPEGSAGSSPDIVQSPNFFTTMIDAVQSPSSIRADLVQRHAAQDHGRGRNRRRQGRDQPRLVPASIPANACIPMSAASPGRSSVSPRPSTAKTAPSNIKGKPLNWGGRRELCTRESKFEVSEQGDCGSRGFSATGFAAGRHVRRRQDIAICDAMMKIPFTTHSDRHHPRIRVIQYSLTSVIHTTAAAYRMPAFAGRTAGTI